MGVWGQGRNGPGLRLAVSGRGLVGALRAAEVTRAVHEGDDLNRRCRDPVHQAIPAHEELAHCRVVDFRDNATALGERRE